MLRFNETSIHSFYVCGQHVLETLNAFPSLPFSHIEGEALSFKITLFDNPPIPWGDHVPCSLLLIRYFLMFMNVKDYGIRNSLTGAAKANLKNWTSPIPSPTTKAAWLVMRRWVKDEGFILFAPAQGVLDHNIWICAVDEKCKFLETDSRLFGSLQKWC